MQFTILTDSRRGIATLAVFALAVVPLAILPLASDRMEAPRAVATSVAVLLAAAAAHSRPARLTRIGGVLAVVYLGLAVVSGTLNGAAAGVFGVHGRFHGLVSLAVAIGAGLVGALVISRRMRLMARALAAGTVLQSLVVWGQSLVGLEPVGLLGNRVPLGAFLALGTVVALAAGLAEKGRARLWLLAASVVGGVALGLAGSRGAWLAAAAGVALTLLLRRDLAVRRNLVLPALMLALVLGASVDVESWGKLSPSALASGSATSRWQIWAGTASMIKEQPLFGVGPGRFVYEYPQYQTFTHAITEMPDTRADQAHSLPLQAAAEKGVIAALVGLALGALALFAGAKGIARRDAGSLVAIAGFSAYAVQGLFGIPSMAVDALGWALGGVLLARGDGAESCDGKRDESSACSRPCMWRPLFSLFGVILMSVSVYYVTVDVIHERAQVRFEAADFADAALLESNAVSLNPLIDVYRVGYADAAAYMSPLAASHSLVLLERGLRLEPDSYDLLLARARAMRRAGYPTDVVADAYENAVVAYPLGIEVNLESAEMLRLAGRDSVAEECEALVTQLGTARMRRVSR